MRRFIFQLQDIFLTLSEHPESKYILRHIGILIRKNLNSETYHHSFSQQFITLRTLKLN